MQVWIRDAKPSQQRYLESFHLLGILLLFMIEAACMQDTMHHQVGGMVVWSAAS